MFILKQRFRWQTEQTNLPNRNHRLRYVLPEYDGFPLCKLRVHREIELFGVDKGAGISGFFRFTGNPLNVMTWVTTNYFVSRAGYWQFSVISKKKKIDNLNVRNQRVNFNFR